MFLPSKANGIAEKDPPMIPVMSDHVLGAPVPGNERKSYEDHDPIGFVVS
jgi:hypothetical protein